MRLCLLVGRVVLLPPRRVASARLLTRPLRQVLRIHGKPMYYDVLTRLALRCADISFLLCIPWPSPTALTAHVFFVVGRSGKEEADIGGGRRAAAGLGSFASPAPRALRASP